LLMVTRRRETVIAFGVVVRGATFACFDVAPCRREAAIFAQ